MLDKVCIAAEKLGLELHELPHDDLELPLGWDPVLELLLNWDLVVLQEAVALAESLELWELLLAVSSLAVFSSPFCGAPLLAGSY